MSKPYRSDPSATSIRIDYDFAASQIPDIAAAPVCLAPEPNRQFRLL
jgi:hypothetical protein